MYRAGGPLKLKSVTAQHVRSGIWHLPLHSRHGPGPYGMAEA